VIRGGFGKLTFPLGAAVTALVGFTLARTIGYGTAQRPVRAEPPVELPPGAGERLAGALRIPTVSYEDPAAFDGEAFRALHRYLEATFSAVHSELRREAVATHSLLYTWHGSDPSLEPILLMGHLDVVPVEPGTERNWRQGPFSGRIADGFIWGRGALDNKAAVVGILEATEMLLREGFRPRRTVFFAFGHDEEVGGMGGAREVAALLKRRGVRLEMILDEGGMIGDGVLPDLSVSLAMVGIAEKGFLSVELSTRIGGGHSSLPPPQNAVGILSAAIARLDRHPMPARLVTPTRQLFERIGPQLSLARRAAFANVWLTWPIVLRRLEINPAANAMVRTTMAPTIFQAGTKDNVLPSGARAVVNFRILPGDSVAEVLEHVRRVIDDERVEISKTGRFYAEPSAVSDIESASFRNLERAIRSTIPDAVVAPCQVVVVTDSRHFAELTANIFRFLPLPLRPGDLERIHGTNERVALHDYEGAIRMYRQLLHAA